MLTSYHNHTSRCNHASGTVEEYILHAIKYGYDVFGFSDHAPHCVPDALADSRMKLDELPFYVDDVRRLADKYSEKIELKIGLELEYLPLYHKRNIEIYKSAGIEYLILGQHYIGNGNIDEVRSSFAFTSDNSEYVKYVDQCIEALRTGDFVYFAHPDVFKYKGDDDFYKEESDRLIRAAMACGIPLEVNMYGLCDQRHYPNDLFWERVGRLGANVILGRDAHSVERVHNEKEFPEAYRFIEKHGSNIIDRINI
jgi:histidinol-phosphatase (PHP family)